VIRAGRLRHRVRIERVVETTNAVGGVSRSWRSIAVRWAGIEPISAREFMKHDQVNSTVTHRIMLRGGGLEISAKDRIVFGRRVFGILSIINRDERDKVLEIMATEDVDP